MGRGAHVDSQKLRTESRVPRAESRETRRVEGRRDSGGESRRREWKWKSLAPRIESRRAEQMFCFDQGSRLSARVRSIRFESSRVASSRVERVRAGMVVWHHRRTVEGVGSLPDGHLVTLVTPKERKGRRKGTAARRETPRSLRRGTRHR